MEREALKKAQTAVEHPDWWPYAREFPQWQVWLGVDRLIHARRVGSSDPAFVTGEDAVDLRDQIRRVLFTR